MGADVDLVQDRLRRDVDLIIGRLRGKKVLIDDTFEVDFVDREAEARYILEGVARIRASKGVIVLYGPRGCGKSRFFDVLTEAIREANENGGTNLEVIYARWDEAEKAVRAVSSGLLENIREEIEGQRIGITFDGSAAISTELDLFRFLSKIISIVNTSRKAREHGRILFVIDERGVKIRRDIENFEAELDSLADSMSRAILKYYRERKGYMTAIVLTSDALAAEAWQKIGTKVDWLLMWSLPRGDFERLADQLGLDADRGYRDLLWSLAGGNPRALGHIAKKGLHAWLEESVIDKVKSTIINYLKDHPETPHNKLWEYIADAAREPLGIIATPLRPYLLEDNIIISLLGSTEISEIPRMPSIRRENAYQLPAYYYALKAIARKGDLNIVPENVIEEARKI